MRCLSEIFRDISWMFVHHFQIITNFLSVCLSVSWLTYFLKLCQYRDISLPVWNIFLNFFGDIPWMFLHYFQIIIKILVCLLVLYLAYILTEIRPLYGYLLFWKSYLSDFFRHSLDVFSSAFALWANRELYILGPSLTVCLCPSGRKLEISVNNDARTLKFCIQHPWT